MKKDFEIVFASLYGLIVVIITGLVFTATYNILYFYSFLLISFLALIYWYYFFISSRKKKLMYLEFLSYSLNFQDRENLESINFPIVFYGEDNNIIWYNDSFKNFVVHCEDVISKNINEVFYGFDVKKSMNPSGHSCRYNDYIYTAYTSVKNFDNKIIYLSFLKEDTELKQKANLYENERPCVMHILLDSFEDHLGMAKESLKNQIVNGVENIFENIVLSYGGKINSVRKDKFTCILPNRAIIELKKEKFKKFDEVKRFQYESRNPITISIGIGINGKDIAQNDEFANQALDMALGRGGDQIVIKNNDDYEFFGESLKDSKKRNKVKARYMSNALIEAINTADNVIVMGHKYADFDSVGSAMGIYRMAKIMDKEVDIAIDITNNMSLNLIKYIKENFKNSIFIDENTALQKINKKTLLVIVDTNSKSLVQFDSVYEKCENIIVIDHHRKVADHISDYMILYHEPFASSTSEMVTEMITYFAHKYKNVDSATSDALLAGVVLDTRNFTIKTTVRTFEVASYLKSCGANTITVRKFFSQSSDVYRMKNEIMSNIQIYKGCGISFTYEEESENLRTVAAQVSDEMLQLNDIIASFVVFEIDNMICVSSRSFGKINVQVIMEKLGGGGHATMSGAQIANSTIDEVILNIKIAIDNYLS